MLQSSREKFLATIVVLSVVIIGSIYLKNSEFGETLFNMQEQIESKKTEITNLISIQQEAFEIERKFTELEKELKLEGDNNEQFAAFSNQLIAILEEVGLKGKYKTINQRDPKMENDFKVLTITINQVECTPQQLGLLLYNLEKQMKVIEIERCEIRNQIMDNGKLAFTSSLADSNQELRGNGLLEVNMQISRLVEYRKGEQPRRRS